MLELHRKVADLVEDRVCDDTGSLLDTNATLSVSRGQILCRASSSRENLPAVTCDSTAKER
jgi:hypothetical protein